MPHTYNRRDCEILIAAKHLPWQIVNIAGDHRLRVNFSSMTMMIKSWDELYAEISEVITQPDPLVPEGVQPIDPKAMTDVDFAIDNPKPIS